MFKRIVNFNSFRRLLAGVPMANVGEAWGRGSRGRSIGFSKEAQPTSPGGSDGKATDTTHQTVYTNTQRAGGGGGGGSRPYNRDGDGFNRGRGGSGHLSGHRGGFGNPDEHRGGFGNPGKYPGKFFDAPGQENMVANSKGYPIAENSQGQEVLGDNYSHVGSNQNQWTQHSSYEGRTARDNDGGQSHDSDSRQEAFPDTYQEKGRGSGPSYENESRQGAHPGACPEHVNESKQGTQPGLSNSDSERNSGRSHGEGNGPTPPPGCYPRSGHESRQETQSASSKGNSDRGSGIGQGKKNDPRQGPQSGSCQGDSGKGGGMGQDRGNGSRQHIQSGSCQEDRGRGKNKGQSSRFHDQGNSSHGYREQQYKGQRQQYYDQDGGYNRQASYDSGYRRDNSDQPRRKRNRDDNEDDVFLSKTLSFLLRHGAEKLKFKLMAGGYLYVDEILKNMQKLDGFTEEDVQRVVAQNEKQRFGLQKEEGTGRLKIRANQGHTVEVEGLELTPITSVDQVPMVLHGTYHDAWNSIQKQGLCRFKRNHIHFAAGEPGDSGVISGMRSSCEVLIIIDLEKALKDGLKFFRSANNVILSPGNEGGYIYPCYFQAVLNRNPRYKLPFDPNIKGKTVSADQIADEFDKKDKRKKKRKNNKNKEDRQNKESGAPPEEMVGVGDTDLFAEEKHEKKEEEEDNEEELFQDAVETPQNDVPEKWDQDGEVQQHHPVSTNSKGAAQSEATQGAPESEASKGTSESMTNKGASGSETPKGAQTYEAPNGTPKSKPEDQVSRSEITKGSAKLDTKTETGEKEDFKPKAQKGSAKQSEAIQGGPESEASKGTAESKTKQGASGSKNPKGATKFEAPNGTPESKPEDMASRSEITKGSAKLDTKKGTVEKEDAKPMTQKGSAKQSETTQGGPESEVSKGTAESKTKQRTSWSETPKGATKSGTPESKPENGASRSETTKGSAKLDNKKGTSEKEDAKPMTQKGNATQILSAVTVEEQEQEVQEEEVKIEEVWEDIFITNVEDSISAVDYILNQKEPVSVISCGDRLGNGDGKIAVLVLTAKGQSWFYQLCNSEVDFMEAGKLKTLLSDPKLNKVFHDVTWLSAVLFKQNEVVLDGTQVFDTNVVLQKKMLNNNDIDNLRLEGFMPARWAQEDSLVDSRKWTQTPLDKQLVEKLVGRCKALLEFYRVFEQKKLKLPKKEIFEEVNKYVDMEKVQEMRKKAKKSQTGCSQTQNQSTSSSSAAHKKKKKKK